VVAKVVVAKVVVDSAVAKAVAVLAVVASSKKSHPRLVYQEISIGRPVFPGRSFFLDVPAFATR
jgi:hypothetical protein